MIDFFVKGLYEPQKLYEISLKNAKQLTGATNINDILKENNIFRVISILMYAPL